MKVTFNAKKDKFYYIFVRGIIENYTGSCTVSVVTDDGVVIAWQKIDDALSMHTVHMNMTVRRDWEGLTTLWLKLDGGSWYFSQTEAPSIVVRTV